MHSIRLRCHCSTMPITLHCHVWTSADDDQKSKLQACNNQCTKLLSCGHRCSYSCHSGNCSPVDQCSQKVTFRCSCKRLKKDLKCHEREKRPVCNEECSRIKKEKEEVCLLNRHTHIMQHYQNCILYIQS
ncbi:PREDICTED: NF-X1-type zinc finger protein NFXL1-like [Amphimedon queenslandica]|uniref:NF-X1-type domain-containing protein n=1 Tax=Amphimedon queenslandica TaxID=400682 RepID=A0AAN0JT38_AMPQE|nr:PREDICTED: NF-X1-type zinc finger protein NFXL1-like [Amphimedon queenslandica]|eukprot:XP_019859991.1 PREDICTED: NF-X1-type zinc finger protein NFXL1-like [Amphimedon queenslandica]